jgi:hypothetical protein
MGRLVSFQHALVINLEKVMRKGNRNTAALKSRSISLPGKKN